MFNTIDECKLCGEVKTISEHTGMCDTCWEINVRMGHIRYVAERNREFALSLLHIVADSGVLADFRLVGGEPVVLNQTSVWNLVNAELEPN